MINYISLVLHPPMTSGDLTAPFKHPGHRSPRRRSVRRDSANGKRYHGIPSGSAGWLGDAGAHPANQKSKRVFHGTVAAVDQFIAPPVLPSVVGLLH